MCDFLLLDDTVINDLIRARQITRIWIRNCVRYLVRTEEFTRIDNTVLSCRAVDPDPHGSAFIFPPRSVSRKKQKKCYVKEIGDNWHLIPFFTVILDQLHGFYTFELFLLSFSTLENSS